MLITPDKLARDVASEISDGLASLSVSQLGEDLFINRFFQKSQPGFYLDIGAFHPKRYSNTYLLRKYMGWKGIHVDANPAIIAEFNKSVPDGINVNAAVDDQEQDVELVIYRGAAHSTIDPQRKEINSAIEVRSTMMMRTRTVESILDEFLPAGTSVDFVNIDVEGRDLQALRSLNIARFRPRLVCVEDHDFISSLNGGRPSPIFSFMKEHGYAFASHTVVSSFYTPSKR